MAVYVDPLINYGFDLPSTPKCFKNKESCHMYADTLQELHEFALKIGLKISWFQNSKLLPHYDLVKSKRILAVRLGAIEHTLVEMTEFRKRKCANVIIVK